MRSCDVIGVGHVTLDSQHVVAIGVLLEPSLYLAWLLRHYVSKYIPIENALHLTCEF